LRAVRTRDALLGPPVRAALRSRGIRRLTAQGLIPLLERTEHTLDRLTSEAEPAREVENVR
jgi:hypothetical protein